MRHSLRTLATLTLLLLVPDALALSDVEVDGLITTRTDTSVTVDATTFRLTSATEIRDDDGPTTADALVVGLVVEARGDYAASGALIATRIDIEDDGADGEIRFEGPITARDGDLLHVGSVPVRITGSTRIDGDEGEATAADLVIGIRVEVRGTLDAAGQVVADRIRIDEHEDDDSDDEDAEGKGPIEDLGPASLTVLGVTFAVTDATRVHDGAADVPFESLVIGQLVEVHGAYASDGTLVATRIEVEDFADDEVELTGAIEGLGPATLTVAGLDVEVTDATIVLDNDRLPIPFESLVVGQFVEIRADIIASGVRRATHITVEDVLDDEVELKAALDAVGAGVVVALGRAFAVDSTTVMPAGLAAGDVVELHAYIAPGGDLFATRIAREDGSADRVELRGPVTGVGPDSLAVIDVPFLVNGATVIVGRDGAPTTLDTIPPAASVEVWADVTEAGWLATRIEVRSAARATGRAAGATAAGFSVGDVAVVLTPDTRIVSASGAALDRVETGQTVAATGTSDAGGLTATRVVVLTGATATARDPEREALVTALAISPNPLAGSGRVRFELAAPGTVELVVVSTLGREVARLGVGARAAGSHTADLNVAALPSGVYLVRLIHDGRPTRTRALTVVR